MSLGPVVASPCLSKDEIVRAKQLAKWTSTHRIHSSRLKIHKDCPRNIATSSCFIVIYVDALQLQVGVAMVGASGIDSVLVRNNFPELGTNLIAALATLDV